MSNSSRFWAHKALIPPLAALTCLLPAHAQAPLHFGPGTAAQSAAVPQSVAAPTKPAQTPEGAMLDTDPRLKQRVTLTLDNVTLSKALVQMSAKTHVSLLADGEQLQTKKISASFVDKPLRDVLDALASLGNFEWVGRKSGAVVLRAIPVPVVSPAVEKYGSAIRGFVDKMTPEQKEALAQPYATPLTDLPPGMQSAVLEALATLPDPIADFGVSGAGLPSSPVPADVVNNPGNFTVGFQTEHQGADTFYYLSYKDGNASGYQLIGHD